MQLVKLMHYKSKEKDKKDKAKKDNDLRHRQGDTGKESRKAFDRRNESHSR